MMLRFITLAGDAFNVSGIASDTTVKQLKLLLSVHHGTPPVEHMRFIYCGQLLDDACTVASASLMMETAIHVVDIRPGYSSLSIEEALAKCREEEAEQQARQRQIEEMAARCSQGERREREARERRAKAQGEYQRIEDIRQRYKDKATPKLLCAGALSAAAIAVPVFGPFLAVSGLALNLAIGVCNITRMETEITEAGLDRALAREGAPSQQQTKRPSIFGTEGPNL
jgi:hypothetical protein